MMTLCRGWRSLPSILAVSVSLSAPADNLGNSQRLSRDVGIADINAALVEILRGSGPAKATHSCWGAVIARHGEGLVVLTAAHCFVPPSQQATTSAYVKWQDAEISLTNKVFVHPRFNPSHRSANFDVATFEVPSRAKRVNAIPIALAADQLRVGESVTVLDKHNTNKPLAWSAVSMAEVTDTSLTLAADTPLCMGSSGAPVLRHGINGYALVGIISSGPSDCSREVKVARVSAAIRGFLENTIEGREPRDVSRSCGECIEQAWEGNAPCVTSVDACRHDPRCTGALACMADPLQKHCSRAEEVPELSFDLLSRAQRCVCRVECRMECANSCAQVVPKTDATH